MPDVQAAASGGITFLERDGAAGAMVFLHGIGSNAASFKSLMENLPSDRRLISWNAPGYGGSTPLPQTWPYAEDYADALARFLDGLGVERATILGHSLGTLIGAAFASRYPERCDRLVLAASACGYGVSRGSKLPSNVGDRIEELELLGAERFAEERAPRLVFEPRLNGEILAQVRDAMSQVDRGGYAQAVRMLASGNLPETLADVHCDVGFIVGINDRVTPEQQTLTAAQAWRHARSRSPEIVRINQAGHAVYLQKPKEFIAALAQLGVSGIDPEPAACAAEGS